MSDEAQRDWHVACPFCSAEFHGWQHPRTEEERQENPYLAMHAHVATDHPDKGMTCPRRTESFTQASTLEGEDHWGKDNTCSYCGSMHPDKLFEAINAGEELGPTDKSYKVYVGHTQKFYFQHLSVEQRKQFIDLINAKTIKLGYPGHFYVLPFFCTRASNAN